MKLRLGTRGSALAKTQSGIVADWLRARGAEVEMVLIRTTGDRLSELRQPIEGKGIFTKELDEALLDRRIDLAVHSMKDLPSELPPGIEIAAVPEREDARDVLVTRDGVSLPELRSGAVVGTGSPRRAGQLRALRPDLVCVDARGNVDTRIRKLREGAWDAIVLARAGLRRLGREDEASQVLEIAQMIPAVAQGALAITVREGDPIPPVRALEHPPSRAAVRCERRILRELEGGCRAPVAAHAWADARSLRVTAAVMSLDGATVIRVDREGAASEPEALGAQAADALLARGAAAIVAAARVSA
ncbi:MAG TPA: hydroxymethylbilane synthase [Thermoanaerobaculia bacterium]|nr:hydroxymethylbilane synthase [Thermoanaerobaculia bacterium]